MACLFFTMGNISGTGAGMNLVTGLNWKVGSALMVAVVIYCYFTKNVYSKVEKIITACILGMIVSFYATLIGVGGPDMGAFGKGVVGFAVPEGSLATSIATPVAGLFVLLLLWREDVNEGYKKPTGLRICMTISYIFVLIMTFSALRTQIPNLLNSLTNLF